MKRSRFIGLAVILALVAQHSQQLSAQADEVLEIEGIQLRLGMNQDLVFGKFRDRNLGVSKIEEHASDTRSSWLICQSPESECNPPLGQVSFSNSRIIHVSKRWASTSKASEVVSALYGAAKDMESRGFGVCRLKAREDVSPGSEVKSVLLRCGEHMQIIVARASTPATPSLVLVEQQLLTNPK